MFTFSFQTHVNEAREGSNTDKALEHSSGLETDCACGSGKAQLSVSTLTAALNTHTWKRAAKPLHCECGVLGSHCQYPCGVLGSYCQYQCGVLGSYCQYPCGVLGSYCQYPCGVLGSYCQYQCVVLGSHCQYQCGVLRPASISVLYWGCITTEYQWGGLGLHND